MVAYKNLSKEIRYNLEVIFLWTSGLKTVMKNGRTIHYQTIKGQDVADWLTYGKEKANSGSVINCCCGASFFISENEVIIIR